MNERRDSMQEKDRLNLQRKKLQLRRERPEKGKGTLVPPHPWGEYLMKEYRYQPWNDLRRKCDPGRSRPKKKRAHTEG